MRGRQEGETYREVQLKFVPSRRSLRDGIAVLARRAIRRLPLEVVLDERRRRAVSTLLLRTLRLLLELAVEDGEEELGEFLSVLLLATVDVERLDERRRVVNALNGLLEKGEEDLKLEDGGRLQREKLVNRRRESWGKRWKTHLDLPIRRWQVRVDTRAELGVAVPNLRKDKVS